MSLAIDEKKFQKTNKHSDNIIVLLVFTKTQKFCQALKMNHLVINQRWIGENETMNYIILQMASNLELAKLSNPNSLVFTNWTLIRDQSILL